MSDRGRRGAGAPFYAPPRRKTSAEIISEARAAVYGEMSSASSGAGALRPLRTRRPFTPREPQRSLFSERTRKKGTRPPSAFDLKYLSLSESSEEALKSMGSRIDEVPINEVLNESQSTSRKKPVVRSHRNSENEKSNNHYSPRRFVEFKENSIAESFNQLRSQPRSVQERSGDGWSAFPRLPHLSGRAKPLHRRNTHNSAEDSRIETELSNAISVTRPSGMDGDIFSTDFKVNLSSKSLSPDSASKRKVFASTKSLSCDTNNRGLGDIGVKSIHHVQLPNASTDQLDCMSILELCDALSQRSREIERTLLLLETLQSRLQASTPASSLRDLVLRSLYKHIDSEDERVLVAIARALLTMRVTGTHLAAACKLVFKIARNDKNDHFFKDTNLLELLVEGCGRADPVSESECCVYGAGALRVLAAEPRLSVRAHAAGAVHLAAIHLKILNTAKSENPRSVTEQSTYALYQLTGALRNLASETRAASAFVDSGALAELLAALLHHTDRDVLTNVARCLSVLSVQDCCCSWLCRSSVSARALLRALAACAARAPLAVRLAYTLGNMAAADDQARNNIYNEEGGIDVLLTILESYTKRNDHDNKDSDPDLHLIGTDLGGSDGSNEDVLIKTVRVVANLCLAENAGRGLAATHAERTVRALLACLELSDKTVEDYGISSKDHASLSERREELATAALATLNNITFYREPPEPPDPLNDALELICIATCRRLLGTGSSACEAVRALGNLTRAPHAAQLVVLQGALDALDPFLDSEDADVRCAAAGVLVNVCGAGAESARAGETAARALEAAAIRGDSATAALLARAVWNADAHAPLPGPHASQAASALAMFIDDESVFAACEASRTGDRRASDPSLKLHVKFDFDNNNQQTDPKPTRTLSMDQHLEQLSEDEGLSGSDLGFEEGDGEECECGPCRRLTAWEELAGVAIPLLEKLRPPRADASVGTD